MKVFITVNQPIEPQATPVIEQQATEQQNGKTNDTYT